MLTLSKEDYRELYEELVQVLYRHDPIGLASSGAPHDEYEPEVGTIISRLRSAANAEDVTRIVYEEFSHWFGAESTTGPYKAYAPIGEEIWLLLNYEV